MITLLLKHQLPMRRWLIGALLAVISVIAAPQQAQAMNAIEAMDKVCGLADGAICGPAYKSVSNNCFHSSDELACAISIVSAVSGSDIPSTVDVILNCAQEGLPISQKCLALLNGTGLDTTKINEAQKIITHCASILTASGATDAIDDAIVCADMVLDSSIAKDAELSVPSWVNSLFDVYMAIRDKDFWMLLAKVGETVACALIDYFLCVDLCSYLGEIYAAGKAVVDTANDIGQGKTPDWVPAPIKSALNSVRKSCDATMPTTKYHELYFAPAIDTVVVGMQKNLSADSWTPVVKPRWNQCKNYYHTRSFAPHDWCKNGEAVAQEYCDRIRDNMFHPAVMHRYFTVALVNRYPQLAVIEAAKIQTQLPAGTPLMRTVIINALGLRKVKLSTKNADGTVSSVLADPSSYPGYLDWGTAGSTSFARAETFVREPYFKAVAKGSHNTGIVYYDFPLNIDGAAQEWLSVEVPKAAKATKAVLDNLIATGCKVANGQFLCDTVAEINACRTIFGGGDIDDNPCAENRGTSAQVEMLRWHKEKRFQKANVACSYDILWNSNAIGCDSPADVLACDAMLRKEYAVTGIMPKKGVMDCQHRITPQKKKWAELMPQLAEVLTPGFVLNLNLNTPTPPSNTKYRACKVDATDPLIARCPGDPIASSHQNFKLAEQLMGKGNADECTAAEAARSPHWVEAPCVIWDRKSAVISVSGNPAGTAGTTINIVPPGGKLPQIAPRPLQAPPTPPAPTPAFKPPLQALVPPPTQPIISALTPPAPPLPAPPAPKPPVGTFEPIIQPLTPPPAPPLPAPPAPKLPAPAFKPPLQALVPPPTQPIISALTPPPAPPLPAPPAPKPPTPAFKPPLQALVPPPTQPTQPTISALNPPVGAIAKPIDKPIAIDGCVLFLGRATELLCNTDKSFEACKPLVDSGKLQTCRRTSTDVYKKK